MELFQNLLKDPKEAIEFVSRASAESMRAHLAGQELKTLDRVTVGVANGEGYRKAVAAINGDQRTIEEVEY